MWFHREYLNLHRQSDLILLFFFSTERKIVAEVYLHLKFTVDLCIPKRYKVCSAFPSFPLRKEAQEATAFFSLLSPS